MGKAKLGTLTEKWINGKTDKHDSIKTEKNNTIIEKKIMQTMYLSAKATKLLRYNRAETGEPMSHTVEKLVIEQLGKNK